MAGLQCSISSVINTVKTACGLSTRYPKEIDIKRLSQCTKPIESHLRQLSLYTHHNIVNEGHLIALRCGLWDADLRCYTVCPFHRDSLGIHWQKRAPCQFPLHEGKSKPYRTISLRMSKAIFENLSTLVPVGSGKYRKLHIVLSYHVL